MHQHSLICKAPEMIMWHSKGGIRGSQVVLWRLHPDCLDNMQTSAEKEQDKCRKFPCTSTTKNFTSAASVDAVERGKGGGHPNQSLADFGISPKILHSEVLDNCDIDTPHGQESAVQVTTTSASRIEHTAHVSGYPTGLTLRVQRNRFSTQLIEAFLANDIASLYYGPREWSPTG